MAESVGVGVPAEMDIVGLKEALKKQQQLLQKLCGDLDKEREASASAASEALSMILRLQGEKAAMNMEASQYKRMAEEKMEHAEESIAIFEELIYQKEMEISSLEFQIESYKYKLLSMGLTEDEFPEDIVSPRIKSTHPKDVGESSIVTRLISLPALALRNSAGTAAAAVEDERSVVTDFETIPSIGDDERGKQTIHKDKSIDLGNSKGSVYGDLNSYWEQIQELDERIKEISSLDVGSRIASDQERVVIEFSHTKDAKPSSPCNSVMDIFEVPVPEDVQVKTFPFPSLVKGKRRMIREEEEEEEEDEDEDEEEEEEEEEDDDDDDDDDDEGDRLKKPDLVLEKTLDASILEDEGQQLVKKKLLRSEYNRPRGDMKSEPKNIGADDDAKLLSKQTKHQKMESDLQLVRATTEMAACRVEMQQLTERIKQLEVARRSTRDEIDEARDEEKCILNEIREQLQFIQSEVTNLRPKKPPTSDDFSLVPLTEGMLYFWL